MDFIVGNPPFIGASAVRRALGDGYADALRSTWNDVPESADFVMHWWHAAAIVARGQARRFGLITTNSLPQTFNRHVIQAPAGEAPMHWSTRLPITRGWTGTVTGCALR